MLFISTATGVEALLEMKNNKKIPITDIINAGFNELFIVSRKI